VKEREGEGTVATDDCWADKGKEAKDVNKIQWEHRVMKGEKTLSQGYPTTKNKGRETSLNFVDKERGERGISYERAGSLTISKKRRNAC